MIPALLLVVGVSTAGSALPPRPSAPATAIDECQQSVPLRVGTPVPVTLLGVAGLVGCSAVCEPLSSYAHLLQLEQDAITVRQLYEINTAELKADRDRWQNRAQAATAVPWFRSPWFVAVTGSTLSAAAVLTYDQL